MLEGGINGPSNRGGRTNSGGSRKKRKVGHDKKKEGKTRVPTVREKKTENKDRACKPKGG